MYLLLPNKFKVPGIIMVITGPLAWTAMQLGYVRKLLVYLFGQPAGDVPAYAFANVLVSIFGFFAFLLGAYFLAFSKEKVEDERIERARMDSFQFAAFLQIVILIVSFVAMLIFGSSSGYAGEALFFILLLFLFWFSFLLRFNYLIHWRPGMRD